MRWRHTQCRRNTRWKSRSVKRLHSLGRARKPREGVDAALIAYQNAIENVDDKRFQARTQLTIARLLFEKESFAAAAEQYNIFLEAYGDVATRIGFSEDNTFPDKSVSPSPYAISPCGRKGQ